MRFYVNWISLTFKLICINKEIEKEWILDFYCLSEILDTSFENRDKYIISSVYLCISKNEKHNVERSQVKGYIYVSCL